MDESRSRERVRKSDGEERKQGRWDREERKGNDMERKSGQGRETDLHMIKENGLK